MEPQRAFTRLKCLKTENYVIENARKYIHLMLELQPRAQHIGHCGFVQTFTTTAAPDQFK